MGYRMRVRADENGVDCDAVSGGGGSIEPYRGGGDAMYRSAPNAPPQQYQQQGGSGLGPYMPMILLGGGAVVVYRMFDTAFSGLIEAGAGLGKVGVIGGMCFLVLKFFRGKRS